MNNKKIIIIVLIVLAILCAMLGVTLFLQNGKNRKVITIDKLKEVAKKYNYEVTVHDVAEMHDATNFEKVESAGLVKDLDNGWYLEFYTFGDDAASKLFEQYSASFDTEKEKSSNSILVEGDNYKSYTLTNKGYYTYLYRVDNEFIYVNQSVKNKETIKEFLKEIGCYMIKE